MIILQSNIGDPSLWAESGGIMGLVLMVLCLVMMGLFGLLAWVFKRIVRNNEETNKEIIKTIYGLQQEISENTLQVSRPLIELNLRIISVEKVLEGFEGRDGSIKALLSEVREELEEVKNHILIMNETFRNLIYKENE